MSATTQATGLVVAQPTTDQSACGLEVPPLVRATWRPSRMAVACQRGMATAEYAIGILAAICVALTLAKFLTGAEFLTPFTKQITEMIGKVGQTIK